MLRRLLQPVTDGVLELLVPLHVTAARRVDAAAAGAQARVPLHEVDQLEDGVGAEVDVAVQGQEERVHRPQPLLLLSQVPVVHDLVAAEEVPKQEKKSLGHIRMILPAHEEHLRFSKGYLSHCMIVFQL